MWNAWGREYIEITHKVNRNETSATENFFTLIKEKLKKRKEKKNEKKGGYDERAQFITLVINFLLL